MTLICLLTTARVGTHMLRSMLSSDELIDLGAPFVEPEAPVVHLRWGDDAAEQLNKLLDQYPNALINIKPWIKTDWVLLVEEVRKRGAKFIILQRKDTFAECLSFALAEKYGCWWQSPTQGSFIKPKPSDIIANMESRKELRQTMLDLLAGEQMVSMYYEDLNVEYVKQKLLEIGVSVPVSEPKTKKISPPIEQYVANLEELRQIVLGEKLLTAELPPGVIRRSDGSPLVVFHGTALNFKEFRKATPVLITGDEDIDGIYFTSDWATADDASYRSMLINEADITNRRIVRAHLVMNNPLDITTEVNELMETGTIFHHAKRRAVESINLSLYDGIIYRGPLWADEYIVWSHDQVIEI